MAFQVLQRLTAIKSNSFQTRLGRRVACVSVRSAAAIVTRAGAKNSCSFLLWLVAWSPELRN